MIEFQAQEFYFELKFKMPWQYGEIETEASRKTCYLLVIGNSPRVLPASYPLAAGFFIWENLGRILS
jgi:hypothetical protein